MKILHIVPSLQPSGFMRELHLLTASSAATSDVHSLDGWRHWLDPRPLWALAEHIREVGPDCLHAFGLPALRAARLADRKTPAIISHPLHDGPPSRLDRWLLDRSAGILVTGDAEAQRCLAAGLSPARLRKAPLGVFLPPVMPAGDARCLVCIGALREDKGFHDALWAFDILHFMDDALELHIVGDGPERGRLEAFAQRIGLAGRIHFHGRLSDKAAVLAAASLVWVPSRRDTGSGVALEAMAAGKPVIASRWPGLAEVVVEGTTGFLVEPGDKMALARQTRSLLLDRAWCERLGAAGRRHVELHHAAEQFAASWHGLCRNLAA